ncbi:sensor histidine kinase (plasmid) [Coraliomargarita sp. W4R53]
MSGRSLKTALSGLALSAIVLGAVQLAVAASDPESEWAVQLVTTVFWIWVAAGIIAWWRRPENATGSLIVLGGYAVFLSGVVNLGIPSLVVIGTLFGTAVLAVTVHLLHAFPSGKLHGRPSIATVVAAYVVSLGLQAAWFFVPADSPELEGLIRAAQSLLGIGVMTVTAVILVRRLAIADRRHRRLLGPMFLYGIGVIFLIPAAAQVLRPLGVDRAVTGTIQMTLMAGLPIAFLVGVLLGGFRRSGDLEALSAWLAIKSATKPAVAQALASTLGDPSLRVVYWAEDRGTFIDASGREEVVDRLVPGYGWLDVHVDSRPVGAIIYDARIIADSAPIRRAGQVMAIAIDRERLTTELLFANVELHQSRLRLVETADHERARIARDLHDGLQVQLVLLAIEAQTIANLPDASLATSLASAQLRRDIDAAAADVRHLVHNVLPAALTEQGLAAATEDLVDRLAIRATLVCDLENVTLPTATAHAGYFVVAEVLSNAVKHSRASHVTISLTCDQGLLRIEVRDDGVGGADISAGTGLHGLVDRVNALGGQISVVSPRGAGTLIKVGLPCE